MPFKPLCMKHDWEAGCSDIGSGNTNNNITLQNIHIFPLQVPGIKNII